MNEFVLLLKDMLLFFVVGFFIWLKEFMIFVCDVSM